MLAASKVKMSGSETKMERRNIYDFFSIKRATTFFTQSMIPADLHPDKIMPFPLSVKSHS